MWKLSVSPKVAAYTLRKLEKQKIIEGYRPLIDHNLLGYSYYKLWINLRYGNEGDLEKLYGYIKDNPFVVYVVKGVGFPEDLDIELMIRNSPELFNFVKDLKRKFPKLVGGYKTLMFANTEKVRYLPF